MLSSTIRRKYLDYFKSNGHIIVPSSPVVPHDDPTLLFANAGMNQFKDVFLGRSKRPYTRAATTQKCIRVKDIDNVGHTSRHCTFFEMLGNFSFGDYFKKEAIAFAWEVSTHIFNFDPDRIWASVYKDDNEAFALWEPYIPPQRIVRLGEKDNFWAMGDTGPCGPCSELLYDRGEKYGSGKTPYEDVSGERFLEFWNLVFMQFNRDASGQLNPLPKKSIDTGAGLERILSLGMHVDNVFLTDILRALVAQIETLSGITYNEQDRHQAPAFHVVADHIRSLSFAIADGAQPSNSDRGYVLRKILRRAVRYGRMLGLEKPFLAGVLPRLVEVMGDDFPELRRSQTRIAEILTLEEENFIRTLQRGGELLGQTIAHSRASKQISGDDAFKLKDTYGFPLEEILLIAKDEDLAVDLARFEKLDQEARERSRKNRKTAAQQFDQNFFSDFTRTHQPCRFEGYDHSSIEARVAGILIGSRFAEQIAADEEGIILLDRTPFYAEMGGQVGDSGQIVHKDGSRFIVDDCISPFPGVVAHIGRITSGILRKGDCVEASIDTARRKNIQNNHTAAHLLHWALEQVLGTHVQQAGSLVDEQHLRFDFTHHKAMSIDELRQTSYLVNEKIRTDMPIRAFEMNYSQAQSHPEIKQYFGEKYGETVRVVDIEFSKELCGGTHTSSAGTIGLFKIFKEGSIAAGVRRIEACTGRMAEEYIQREEDLLQQMASALKTPISSVHEKLQMLIDENKYLTQEVRQMRAAQLKQTAASLVTAHAEKIKTAVLIARIVTAPIEDVPLLAQEIMNQLCSGIVAIGAVSGEKCCLLIQVSEDLSSRFNAQELIKEAAVFIQGGGGGKASLAQAGGKNPSGLPKALQRIREIAGRLA
jgi:alanyl-tRNA synthetase